MTGSPPWKLRREVLKLRHTRPHLFSRCAQKLHDFKERAYLKSPGKSGYDVAISAMTQPADHMSTEGPYFSYFFPSQEKLRGPIPQRDNVVSIDPWVVPQVSSQPEVAYLQTVLANQDVLWLEISVDNAANMARVDPV
eukprot:CAMPEP_0178462560 /NCGR_PEP_ID=MMETSP0689_2-20121128/49886_1 /TAXON_ID=160604 /ORGANISM="Amphidinium massartii, Strain CS-259" /LENGTH=137 /DNA_ID=CAMNT_0020089427 /DNA_START=405 /DNA_END=819 /DNA_ORIENTATION=-